MPVYDIVNGASGARGVNGFLFEAGETYEGIEMTESEAELLATLSGIAMTLADEAPKRRGRPPKAVEPEPDPGE